MIDQEQGLNDSVATSPRNNSYLNDYDDFARYEAYMKSQGISTTEVAATQPAVLTDAEKNFVALREKTERLEKENQDLQRNFDYLRNTVQKPAEPVRSNPLDELDQDDAVTARVLRSRDEEFSKRQQALEQEVLRLNQALKYPDYNDVVENFTAPLFKDNPNLAAGFYAAPDPYKYAYDLGVMARKQKQEAQTPIAPPKPPPMHPHAQKILENSRKPGSLANTGGQGSFHAVKDFANMSDEEFEAEYAKVQARL